MIIVFDLDDTLYPEITYVRSGFRAVAHWAESKYGWPRADSYNRMCSILESQGRGQIFNIWFESQGITPTRHLIARAISEYRHHNPTIVLPEENLLILRQLRTRAPLYMVTDGHKIVQAKKVETLNVHDLFERIYLTSRYGRSASKPSPRCFELIRRREKTTWDKLVYIGDNPAKDFVTLNQLGCQTIRVMTGEHAEDLAQPGFDAIARVKTLQELPDLLFPPSEEKQLFNQY